MIYLFNKLKKFKFALYMSFPIYYKLSDLDQLKTASLMDSYVAFIYAK